MINTISQLVPQQGQVKDVPVATRESAPVVAIAGNEVREPAVPVVQGSMEAEPVTIPGDAVEKLNEYARGMQRNIEFSIDDKSGDTIVRVIDTETDEVIRQIPTEDMLVLIENMTKNTGNIFDEVV